MPKFCTSAKAIKTKFRDKNQGINNLISIIKQDKTTCLCVAKHFLDIASFFEKKVNFEERWKKVIVSENYTFAAHWSIYNNMFNNP